MKSSSALLSISISVAFMLFFVHARPQNPSYFNPYSGYPYGGQVPYTPNQNAISAADPSPSSLQQQGVESHFAPGAQYPWLSVVYDSH